ncbi:MAG: YkoF family thiamine/hydroxymethylpyrimidine-binding protein [Chloroflexota bacterium]|jgi:uncharacterized protein YqgV (UPF0045/DUF77 family)|nr:thiamine-binding protein [Dehalococcoidia bacterium]MDW8046661.1 YkoF family thiamine/hydroxymethylpyrimidine-binding protein [Chloroflexota bacterium]
MIQATVAVYPLAADGSGAIEAAIAAIAAAGLEHEVRSMHTELRGSAEAVFAAIRAAWDAAAARGGVVMAVTVSNACPLP